MAETLQSTVMTEPHNPSAFGRIPSLGHRLLLLYLLAAFACAFFPTSVPESFIGGQQAYYTLAPLFPSWNPAPQSVSHLLTLFFLESNVLILPAVLRFAFCRSYGLLRGTLALTAHMAGMGLLLSFASNALFDFPLLLGRHLDWLALRTGPAWPLQKLLVAALFPVSVLYAELLARRFLPRLAALDRTLGRSIGAMRPLLFLAPAGRLGRHLHAAAERNGPLALFFLTLALAFWVWEALGIVNALLHSISS